MYNYFNEYIFSKIVIAFIMRNNYSFDIPIEDIKNYDIDYNENDINDDSISCCFHQFQPEGEYIWNILNIKNPIITKHASEDILFNIRFEQEDIEKNYYRDFIKMSLIVINMIEKNFISYFSEKEIEHIENVRKIKINYDEDIDLIDENIKICFHDYMKMGELSWILLDFDEDFIPYSELLKKKKELMDNLIEYDNSKNLKSIKYIKK